MPFADRETILTSGRSNEEVSTGFTEIRDPGSDSKKRSEEVWGSPYRCTHEVMVYVYAIGVRTAHTVAI